MITHEAIDDKAVRRLIRQSKISLAGNQRLKVFGLLNCKSGRRMKRTNRVFFMSLDEGLIKGYRPCGHCMKKAYQQWKHEII